MCIYIYIYIYISLSLLLLTTLFSKIYVEEESILVERVFDKERYWD